MAVTRKTTSRKTTATPKEKVAPVVEEKQEIVEVEAPKPVERAKKRSEINRDDLIECRSAVSNLVFLSKRTSE